MAGCHFFVADRFNYNIEVVKMMDIRLQIILPCVLMEWYKTKAFA